MLAQSVVEVVPYASALALADLQDRPFQPLAFRNLARQCLGALANPLLHVPVQGQDA